MLDEWTSRLLWLDPNDNELALRFHYDTLFINNIQTIRVTAVAPVTVRAEARTFYCSKSIRRRRNDENYLRKIWYYRLIVLVALRLEQ